MSINKYLNKHLPLNFDLSNKIFVITGANSGIGYELAKLFANYNATIVFACRNKEKAVNAINNLKSRYENAKFAYLYLDQSSLESVDEFVNQLFLLYPNFDSLILNAGILFANPDSKTKDGFYLVNGTNFIGIYYLINKLNQLISSSNVSCKHKIIFQGSFMTMFSKYKKGALSNKNSHGFKAYNISKLGVESVFYNFVKNNGDTNMVYALAEPGACRSNIYHNLNKILIPFADLFMSVFFHSTEKGALPAFMLAANPNIKNGDMLIPRGILSLSGFPKKGKIRKKVKRNYLTILNEAEDLLNSKYNL